jgi:hypothetical protein
MLDVQFPRMFYSDLIWIYNALVRFNMDQKALVRFNMDQKALVRFNMDQKTLIRYNPVQT